MKITDEKIKALAKLARLSFEGIEREHIRQDLENILGMCEQLHQGMPDLSKGSARPTHC